MPETKPLNPTQKTIAAILRAKRSIAWIADKTGSSVRSVENWRDGAYEPGAAKSRVLTALAAKAVAR